MSEHEYTEAITSKATLAQRSTDQAAEPQMGAATTIERDAVDRVVCRAGDASCAKAHATTVGRSAALDRTPAAKSVLRLQRQYGNRYAREVLNLARRPENDGASPSVERTIEAARGGGQALDTSVRHQMEPSFGANFSGVRVHTDARADALNHSLSAKAFATGQDIFFRQDAYSPGTSSGRELLAHELTHVVQQNGDTVHRQMSVSQPGDRHEVEADHMARAVMQQEQQAAPQRADRLGVERVSEEEKKHLHTKADGSELQRQPEAPKHKEEEEKKKLHAKLENNGIAQRAEEE